MIKIVVKFWSIQGELSSEVQELRISYLGYNSIWLKPGKILKYQRGTLFSSVQELRTSLKQIFV